MESFKEGYIYYMKLQVQSIRAALIRWYDSAKRDLPWRRTRDPYAIWISEIMLQQTRVAAVIPYYHRFLSAFPDAKPWRRLPKRASSPCGAALVIIPAPAICRKPRGKS